MSLIHLTIFLPVDIAVFFLLLLWGMLILGTQVQKFLQCVSRIAHWMTCRCSALHRNTSRFSNNSTDLNTSQQWTTATTVPLFPHYLVLWKFLVFTMLVSVKITSSVVLTCISLLNNKILCLLTYLFALQVALFVKALLMFFCPFPYSIVFLLFL